MPKIQDTPLDSPTAGERVIAQVTTTINVADPSGDADGDPAAATGDPTPDEPRRSAGRRGWWLTALAFAFLGSVWAIASPLMSVPDETSHMVRAAAASRGQILPGDIEGEPYFRLVEIPEVLASAMVVPHCYAEKDSTADCAPDLRGSTRSVEIGTTAGTYPPAYYAFVGLPSLVFPSAKGVYLMRILNAAACGALIASAIASLRHSAKPRLAQAGLALAVTPMVLTQVGGINPSGVEIAAGLCLWTSLFAALEEPASNRSTRLLVRIAVSGSVLVMSRPASPLWLVLIGVSLACWFGIRRVGGLLSDRRMWPVLAAVGTATLSTLLWVRHYGTLDQVLGPGDGSPSVAENVRTGFGKSRIYLDWMIGGYGWVDTGLPTATVYLWLLALGALLLLALALADLRHRLVLLGLTVAVVVLPVALQVPRAETQGFPWQGRYLLPFAVGLPVLTGLALDRSRDVPARMGQKFLQVILAVWVVAQLGAHIWETRRYTAGANGPINWLTAGGWHAPVPIWTMFVAMIVALGACAAVLYSPATWGSDFPPLRVAGLLGRRGPQPPPPGTNGPNGPGGRTSEPR